MKIFDTLLLLIFFFSGLTGNAQTNDITGSWTVDYNRTFTSINNSGKFNRLSEQAQQNVKEAFENRQFLFKDGGIIQVVFNSQGKNRVINGEYLYDKPFNNLSIAAQGMKREYNVVWESADTIHLYYKDVSEQAVLQSLILKRNK